MHILPNRIKYTIYQLVIELVCHTNTFVTTMYSRISNNTSNVTCGRAVLSRITSAAQWMIDTPYSLVSLKWYSIRADVTYLLLFGRDKLYSISSLVNRMLRNNCCISIDFDGWEVHKKRPLQAVGLCKKQQLENRWTRATSLRVILFMWNPWKPTIYTGHTALPYTHILGLKAVQNNTRFALFA